MDETFRALKMLVHIAENGQSFELECQHSSSVELVQEWLASLTHVPVQDQLLICGDTRLESNRSLASYKLPAEGRDVFLFNRTRLMADSSPPTFEQPDIIEAIIPPPPSTSIGGHLLDEASDPALKALPSYERQFKYHFQKGHAIFTSSQSKIEACRRLLREQQVQKMALETATGNMDHYYRIIYQMYGEFMKHFNWQHKQHADLLTNFERDLDRLRACKLHPALISDSHRTLVDCIKEAGLRKSLETCAISHKQFQLKVQQLKSMHMELQRNVEELFYNAPSVNIHEVEEMIDNHEHFIDEETIILQSLSKDVNTVKKLVDDCLSSHLSASLRPHDAVSALGPMYDVHDKNHLPRMEVCSKELGKLLEYCRARKHEMSLCVHTSVQRVATLQSSIRDMRNQLSAFKEAMTRQDEIFYDLKLVRRIGPAYKACLAEVVRRKAGMKLYMGQAGQLAEILAQKREVEIAHREEFLRVQSAYIPQDMLGAMGLFDVPSQCVVNIVPYDTNLLDMDMTDMERYAPESLVGPLLKGFASDQGLQGRSTLTTSGISAVSGSGEDNNKICGEGFDFKTIEDVNSDEIAGTSKMEVENAWLKAELASAIALLCNLDSNLDEYVEDDNDVQRVENSRRNSAQKTAEALDLKNEYAKHLQLMLKTSQLQCTSYEKRIRELEQRLSDQYMELQKSTSTGASSQDPLVAVIPLSKVESKSEASVLTGDSRMLNTVSVLEPMDGVSSSVGAETRQLCPSNDSRHTDDSSHTDASEHGGRFQEGGDETMSDFSGGATTGDAAMFESHREEMEKSALSVKYQTNKDVDIDVQQPLDSRSFSIVSEEKEDNTGQETALAVRERDKKLLALQETLEQRTTKCAVLEEKITAALEDVACLRTELEGNAKLFSEYQMNCAHLENRLHEAREEAHTNLCAADRRAVEYNALRASYVRLCGLVERLRHCVSTPQAGTAGFAESIRVLAVSLGSSDDDGNADFRACIRALSERVGWLAQQRAELLERCTKAEVIQNRLMKELESKAELVKNLCAKQKIDKQVISLSPPKPVNEGTREQARGFEEPLCEAEN